jgi:manganese-dependent ADP-ribose/CDP-alcohol diphosphatase
MTEERPRFNSKFRSSSLGEESGKDYLPPLPGQESLSLSAIVRVENSDDAALFSVGLLADIQYAPIPDGFSFSGSPRYYRHALDATKHAFEHFEETEMELVLNLGDTIDGKCQDLQLHGGDSLEEGVNPGHYSLNHVLQAIAPYTKGPILHTYGNHCLYNLNRQELGEKLGIPFVKEPCGELVGYFHHAHKGIRFVVVDSYDVAILQRCEITSQKRKEANEILSKNNPNFPDNMNSPEGLDGLERRFVGFNGGVGKIQLSWLRETLGEARRASEKVIVLSHQPIIPDSSNPVCLMWNYDEVLAILREHSDVVVASFSGHAHQGGYVRDPESGIHFRVLEAVLENKPEMTYAMVDVHCDQVVVRGYGNCHSAVYDFEHTRAEKPASTTVASSD